MQYRLYYTMMMWRCVIHLAQKGKSTNLVKSNILHTLRQCKLYIACIGLHVAMFYYTLANIRPEQRSNLATIQLLTVTKSEYVNKYGIDKILEPFIQEMAELEQVQNTVHIHIYMHTGME